MDFFFNPKAVAVVGATPNPFKGGCSILKNLMAGYQGGIYPINPRYDKIEGLPAFPSVSAVDGPVDLAIIFVPAKATPGAVEDCIRKGVSGIIIESGGFAETGTEGRMQQQRVLDMAKGAGIRLWGPNCMGLVDAVHGRVFSFMDPRALQTGLVPGNVSLVVQSGMLSAGFLVDIMTHGIMGISKVCSVGNKMDVDECDLVPWLLRDPDTAVIGLYLETITDGRRFINLCRGSVKPIVVLKGGKSARGAQAAMSHTASLAGNRRIVSRALAQAGVVEACDFKQMMDLCRSLATVPAKASDLKGGVAILTFSGGAGIVSSDFLEDMGLTVADFADDTKKNLQAVFPDWMPVANPVDLWPAMEKNAATDVDIYSEAMKAVLADPAVDAVLLHVFVGNFRIRINLPDLAQQSRAAGKPVFIWLLGRREEAYQFQMAAREHGVPVFQELYRAVDCLRTVMNQKKHPSAVIAAGETGEPSPLSPVLKNVLDSAAGPLDEFISKKILNAYGVPTVEEVMADNVDECLQATARIGYPVVMKGLQAGDVHKTELGLVYLDIRNKSTATKTFRTITRKMGGRGRVLIQKHVRGHVELILGLLRDQQFGPCVMIGLGGILAEVFQDAVFAMAPLNHQEALVLTDRLQVQKLLDGFRGSPPVNRDELARILTALGNIGLAHPRIQEIDINPLIITAEGAVAVDATIIVR
ncbi:MAG: CoA-binding protein [Deltaproteobacteria bacterium HGW-Deltaproteobacteria-11]|nr:MAG: CoA-binding protein [Deltaproteobacteria bacterium HGW-Deltaproteobacteria-11]